MISRQGTVEQQATGWNDIGMNTFFAPFSILHNMHNRNTFERVIGCNLEWIYNEILLSSIENYV